MNAITQITGQVTPSLVRPAIFNLEIEFGLKEEDQHIKKWGWVMQNDLLTCIHYLFRRKGISPITPREVFDRYGFICNPLLSGGTEMLVTWVLPNRYVIDGCDLPTERECGEALVPAGWANRIINIVEKAGVVRVTSVPCDDIERLTAKGPERLYPIRHQLVAHKYDGTKGILHRKNQRIIKTDEIPLSLVIE